MKRIDLISHLIQYGAVTIDHEKRFIVTDDVLFIEALALIGINGPDDLERVMAPDLTKALMPTHWRN